MKKIAIIGGGAAGLIAADTASENRNVHVTVFDKNAVLAKKLRITGKGRCNITNIATVPEMQEMIPRGYKFLLRALYAFPSREVQSFFESRSVPLKTERGGRVFPVSDKASDIAEALISPLKKRSNVKFITGCVTSIIPQTDGFLLHTGKENFFFDKVLVATGGASYPLTGSTGDGIKFAEKMGLQTVPFSPALCPLCVKESLCRDAMGLSLKNCAIRIFSSSGKLIYEDFGELLFTHFGLSGPIILSASSYLDFEKEKEYRLQIDLKPALTEEELDKRILSDWNENKNKDLINALDRLLPQKLILPIILCSGLDPRKKVNLLTREERRAFLNSLKRLPLTLTGHRPIEEAIVTRGGVALQEINPQTMESKKIPGLYFAGEVLDADGLTGGFNLQIALSTGRLAGENLSREEL